VLAHYTQEKVVSDTVAFYRTVSAVERRSSGAALEHA
jgi:hypothetical protein